MSFDILARQKQTVLTGSHVSYYLQAYTQSDGSDVVVECEDCIEAVDMNFATATVFKSLWRRCKLRQGLGKPGSTFLYEIEKVLYYSDRIMAQTQWRAIQSGGYSDLEFNLHSRLIIPNPKRLDPYSFDTEELIVALETTPTEAIIFRGVFAVAQLRRLKPMSILELDWAEKIQKAANEVEAAERSYAEQR